MKLKWFLAFAACIALQAEDITPRVGYIEVYGASKNSEKKIRSALGIDPGSLLPISPKDLETRIDKLPGVIDSHVEAVCCDTGKMVLYVGVEEKTTPHIDFHPLASTPTTLPQDLQDAYHAFLDAVSTSAASSKSEEDLTHGYSLMADSVARERQQAFLPLAARDLATLDVVVRNSSDPEQRALAAYLLQYAPRGPRTTNTMVNALQYALRDPDPDVRQNAMRSLKAVAVGARLHPDQQIRIEPTWYVELLNSVDLSDRRNASLALVDLTEKRTPESLDPIRDRAVASVVDMARWHDLKYALPGFILTGRLAGLTDKQIEAAWLSNDREAVIQKALKLSKNHSKSQTLESSLRN